MFSHQMTLFEKAALELQNSMRFAAFRMRIHTLCARGGQILQQKGALVEQKER